MEKIKRDVNGNPRYVFPYTDFLGEKETGLSLAKKRAKSLGGKPYKTKISDDCLFVFQSYDIDKLIDEIEKTRNS